MTALVKYAARLATWFALAYLGYWCALLCDRTLVQVLVYAAVHAPTIDWTLTPFWVNVVAPGAFPGQRPLATYLLVLGLPFVLDALIVWLALRRRATTHGERSAVASGILLFASLWITLLWTGHVATFALAGFGPFGQFLRTLFAGLEWTLWQRLVVTAITAAAILPCAVVAARRLVGMLGVVTGDRLSAGFRRLAHTLLLFLPAAVILFGITGFSFRFGFRLMGLVLTPAFVVAALALAVSFVKTETREGLSYKLTRGGALAGILLAFFLYYGLGHAREWQTQMAEARLERFASAHYEISYPGSQGGSPDGGGYTRASVETLAAEREQVLQKVAARLGIDPDEVRVRLILYPDSVSKRIATRDDRYFTITGMTVRAVWNEELPRIDPAADAAVALNSVWGAPGSPVIGGWVARWLAGEWRERPLSYWAGREQAQLGHHSIQELLSGGPDGTLSPLVREPMGAAWVGLVREQFGVEGVRKLYILKSSPASLAAVAAALGAAPEQLETTWEQRTREWAAAIPPPAPRTNTLPPGFFFRGVTFSHEGWGGRRGGYDSPEAAHQLAWLRQSGVNAISVVPYSFLADTAATVISYSSAFTDETDEELTHALHVAHQLGMKVMLKPQIWVSRGHFTGQIQFDDPQQRAAWMRSYREYILHYARLAELEGFDLFCIGNELEGMTTHAEEWRAIIADVRRVYRGPITYAANWGREFESLAFWDALDYAGLNNYYPLLQDDAGADSSSRAQQIQRGALRQAGTLHAFYDIHRKPILLTEVGYPSVRGAASEPWNEDINLPVDLQEQAQCYDAVFRAMDGRSWLAGMFWWKWPSHGRGGGPEDRSFTPVGKPAAEVMRAWYTRMAGANHVAGGAP